MLKTKVSSAPSVALRSPLQRERGYAPAEKRTAVNSAPNVALQDPIPIGSAPSVALRIPQALNSAPSAELKDPDSEATAVIEFPKETVSIELA